MSDAEVDPSMFDAEIIYEGGLEGIETMGK
jgi:hypothetical protein